MRPATKNAVFNPSGALRPKNSCERILVDAKLPLANIWRTGDDLIPPVVETLQDPEHEKRVITLKNVLDSFDSGLLPEAQHTGYYNDLDMMVMGMRGMSNAMDRIHMGLWVISSKPEATVAAPAGGALIAHNVYFSLKENSPAAKKQMVEACKKYLSKHPGTVYFAAGTLAEDLKRPVNDLDFDVALHLVFKDMASHDQYQSAARHLKFIEENKDSWKKVRVFDSRVEE